MHGRRQSDRQGPQLVGARHSFVCQQNCTRSSLARSRIGRVIARSTPSAYSRAAEHDFSLDNAIAMPMLCNGGATEAVEHRITVRLGDEHVAHLQRCREASGLDRNEVVRRLIVERRHPDRGDVRGNAEDPKASGANRIGSAAFSRRHSRSVVEKAAIRRTLAEIERTSAQFDALIGRLARP